MVARKLMFAHGLDSPGIERARGTGVEDEWLAAVRPLNPFVCLSTREREIAALVASGSSNKEIARQLRISPNTVSSHLRQIFAKLGLVRRAELCRLWYRSELLLGAAAEDGRDPH